MQAESQNEGESIVRVSMQASTRQNQQYLPRFKEYVNKRKSHETTDWVISRVRQIVITSYYFEYLFLSSHTQLLIISHTADE